MDPGPGSDPGAIAPLNLKLRLAEQKLLIDWSDGGRSEVMLAELRRHCPCATCRTERESAGTSALPILKADPAALRVTDARLVGNYAVQLFWSDGHQSGLFDFRFLRALSGR